MRKLILATVLAATAAFGVVRPSSAQAADVRVYVDMGDVAFEYGRPYYRYNHEPLYVIYDSYNHPVRYYRVVNSDYYYSNYGDGYYRSSPPPWAPAYGWRGYHRRHHHHYYYDNNGGDNDGRWHDRGYP
jgi:hypothetical protein